jgi:acyl carrier protein
MWSDVLGVAQVGVDDNFFELGGDSLSSVELLARIGARLDVELTIRDLIGNQTVADLATALAPRLAGPVGAATVGRS